MSNNQKFRDIPSSLDEVLAGTPERPVVNRATAIPGPAAGAQTKSQGIVIEPWSPDGPSFSERLNKALESNKISHAVAVGPRPVQQRRAASLWEKFKYVVTPALVWPTATLLGMTVGGIALGATAGILLPGITMANGIAIGSLLATSTVPMLVGGVQLAGLAVSINRMKIKRPALGELLDQRRIAKAVEKASGQVIPPSNQQPVSTGVVAPAKRSPGP